MPAFCGVFSPAGVVITVLIPRSGKFFRLYVHRVDGAGFDGAPRHHGALYPPFAPADRYEFVAPGNERVSVSFARKNDHVVAACRAKGETTRVRLGPCARGGLWHPANAEIVETRYDGEKQSAPANKARGHGVAWLLTPCVVASVAAGVAGVAFSAWRKQGALAQPLPAGQHR